MKTLLPRLGELLPGILGVAGLFAIVAGMKLGKELFVTVVVAGMIAVILCPVVNGLRKWRVARAPAVVLVIALALTLIGGIGYVIVGQVASVGSKLPEYRENLRSKVAALHAPLAKAVRDVQDAVNEIQGGKKPEPARQSSGSGEPLRVEVVESSPPFLSLLAAALAPSMGALGYAAAVILLVSFFLVYSAEIHDRLIRLAGTTQGTVASQAIADSMDGVVRYIGLQAVINVTHGTVLGVGLWSMGVPNALLWGFAGAFLRFVPYLGPVVSGVLPVALAVVLFPGWSRPLWVAAFVVVLETVSNNVLEPLVYGKRTGLSPLAIIVATVFWAWLWDGMGLLLSVPMTVCLLALGRHVPQLQFLQVLLGGEPAVDPTVQIYFRLLGRNPSEAAGLIEKEGAGKDMAAQCDDLLLPVLRMVDADQKDGKIGHEKAREVIDEIRNYAADAMPPAEEPSGVSILCLPASDGTDEAAASMLAGILASDHHRAPTLAAATLAGEKLEIVGEEKPGLVVISALPPSNIMKARYLYKRLRARFPELPIYVGVWGATNMTALNPRIAPDGKATLLSSFTEARQKLREQAEAERLRKTSETLLVR